MVKINRKKTYTKKKRVVARLAPKKSLFGAMSAKQKLKYCDSAVLASAGIGAISTTWVRANGMFDPWFGVGGHQPHYFDQCMAFYDHFTVLNAKITIRGEANDNNNAMVISISAEDTTNSYLNLIDVMESKHGNYIYVPSASSYTSTQWKISHTINMSKFFGKPMKDIINDNLFRGSAAQDPIEQCYFQVSAFSVDTSTSLSAMNVIIDVEYYASFNEPKQILQS